MTKNISAVLEPNTSITVANGIPGKNATAQADNSIPPAQLEKMDRYLHDNPLLREPLKLSHVKPLVVGHWGTTPGQNFIYVHLNRVIKKYDLDTFYIAGPGHAGPALVGGISSHVAPTTPGSIHEGGEFGYSLSHAFGAAFDNPGRIVACIIGDGEAETGRLATAWHPNKLLNPVTDGAVLPILQSMLSMS